MSDCSTNAFARRKPQKSYDDLERRCQQPEQVALDMLDELTQAEDVLLNDYCLIAWGDTAKKYRKRLAALGVKVDGQSQ